MISALRLYDWEKSFWIGKKPFNLALGMGPYFGPMRALEKALIPDHLVHVHYFWGEQTSCRHPSSGLQLTQDIKIPWLFPDLPQFSLTTQTFKDYVLGQKQLIISFSGQFFQKLTRQGGLIFYLLLLQIRMRVFIFFLPRCDAAFFITIRQSRCLAKLIMPACQAGRQFVPFLWWSLMWPGQGVNHDLPHERRTC